MSQLQKAVYNPKVTESSIFIDSAGNYVHLMAYGGMRRLIPLQRYAKIFGQYQKPNLIEKNSVYPIPYASLQTIAP